MDTKFVAVSGAFTYDFDRDILERGRMNGEQFKVFGRRGVEGDVVHITKVKNSNGMNRFLIARNGYGVCVFSGRLFRITIQKFLSNPRQYIQQTQAKRTGLDGFRASCWQLRNTEFKGNSLDLRIIE